MGSKVRVCFRTLGLWSLFAPSFVGTVQVFSNVSIVVCEHSEGSSSDLALIQVTATMTEHDNSADAAIGAAEEDAGPHSEVSAADKDAQEPPVVGGDHVSRADWDTEQHHVKAKHHRRAATERFATHGAAGSGSFGIVVVMIMVISVVLVGLVFFSSMEPRSDNYEDRHGRRSTRPTPYNRGRPLPPPRVSLPGGPREEAEYPFHSPMPSMQSQLPSRFPAEGYWSHHPSQQGFEQSEPGRAASHVESKEHMERASLASVITPGPPSIVPRHHHAPAVPAASPPSITPSLSTLPPLCPQLVMPHCEAWFAIPFEKLMEGVGSFHVLGYSSNELLRVVARQNGAIRTMDLSMTPPRSPVLASIRSGTQTVEVLAAGQMLYGEISCIGAGRFKLVRNGKPVLFLSYDALSGQLVVHGDTNEDIIAVASRCTELGEFAREEHIEVRVNKGVDGVLVLCCVLAVSTMPPTSARASII